MGFHSTIFSKYFVQNFNKVDFLTVLVPYVKVVLMEDIAIFGSLHISIRSFGVNVFSDEIILI